MTKTPGEVEPQKPISKAEREARKAFRQVDAENSMTDHESAQKAFLKNRELLKAERLERESAAPPLTKIKPKAKKMTSVAAPWSTADHGLLMDLARVVERR